MVEGESQPGLSHSHHKMLLCLSFFSVSETLSPRISTDILKDESGGTLSPWDEVSDIKRVQLQRTYRKSGKSCNIQKAPFYCYLVAGQIISQHPTVGLVCSEQDT